MSRFFKASVSFRVWSFVFGLSCLVLSVYGFGQYGTGLADHHGPVPRVSTAFNPGAAHLSLAEAMRGVSLYARSGSWLAALPKAAPAWMRFRKKSAKGPFRLPYSTGSSPEQAVSRTAVFVFGFQGTHMRSELSKRIHHIHTCNTSYYTPHMVQDSIKTPHNMSYVV